MKFINYCIVLMKPTQEAINEVHRISEITPNILDAKGIVIATFISALEPKELNEWFTANSFNFLLFDLNPESSGFNLVNKKLHNGLFSFLETGQLENKEIEFLDAIINATKNKVEKAVREKVIGEKEIESMSTEEKSDLFNKLLDSGIENLSENDKKLLQLLAK